MLSLEEYKKQVKRETQDLTDEEIEQIYNTQYKLIEIFFDEWLKDKNIRNKSLQ